MPHHSHLTSIDCFVDNTIVVFVRDKTPHINQLFGQLLPEQGAACRVPYNALSNSMYITCSPFSITTYSPYIASSISSSILTISPVNLTCTSSSISACMNAPGTSRTATSRFSKASITAVRKTASLLTVGAVESSLAIYALCFRPSAHPHPLIYPQRLRLRNMR